MHFMVLNYHVYLTLGALLCNGLGMLCLDLAFYGFNICWVQSHMKSKVSKLFFTAVHSRLLRLLSAHPPQVTDEKAQFEQKYFASPHESFYLRRVGYFTSFLKDKAQVEGSCMYAKVQCVQGDIPILNNEHIYKQSYRNQY